MPAAMPRGTRSSAALSAVVVAALAVVSPAAVAGEEAAGEVTRLIEDLGAEQFAQREAAARRLLAVGRPALEPLAAAVAEGDLETASRAIGIVRDMLGGDDEAAAESFLRRCAAGPGPAARLAEAALAFHALDRARAARVVLESLGAVIREEPGGEGDALTVEFRAAWRGTSADFARLMQLQGVASVGLYGVKIDDEGLAVLCGIGSLERLDLFGTGAGPEEEAILRTRLPDTRIDVRKGGRLGVAAMRAAGPCEIGIVEPGSAADQAGLRTRDVVLAVDGGTIDDFAALTARLATRGAGEVVVVTVAREAVTAGAEPERLDLEVRLESW